MAEPENEHEASGGTPGRSDPIEGKRPHSPHYKADNSGGYGNPPVKNQFRPGQAGPGRRKGVTNLESAIRRRLRTRLRVSRDGKAVRLTPYEIYAERVLEAILSKTTSPRMLEFGLNFLSRFGPVPEPEPEPEPKPEPKPEPTPDYTVFSTDEFRLFGGLIARSLVGIRDQSDLAELCWFDEPIEGLYRVRRREDGHIVVEKLNSPHSDIPRLPAPQDV